MSLVEKGRVTSSEVQEAGVLKENGHFTFGEDLRKVLSIDLPQDAFFGQEDLEVAKQNLVVNYNQSLKTPLEEWRNVYHKHRIEYGPIWNVVDKRKEGQVRVLSYKYPSLVKGYRFAYIAYGEDNKIIGFRYDKVVDAMVTGNIGISPVYRGKGSVAGSIELVRDVILKDYATSKRIDDLCIRLTNNNANQLSIQEEKYLNFKDSAQVNEILAELWLKAKEQQRWRALYGPGGALGFGADYKKHYRNNFEASNNFFENYSEVEIVRNSEDFNDRVVMPIARRESEEILAEQLKEILENN
jgi:hypothetical protein